MAKQKTSIAVITPSFNQAAYIKRTIDSVLAQNYPNLEYWVIDGGSTDGTLSILKSYGKKINWLSEKDSGQTEAINKGMKLVTADIVCYLNSDDVFLPNALETVEKVFSQSPKAIWATGDYHVIDTNDKKIHSFIVTYKRLLRNLNQAWILYIANVIAQPSTFWRRSAFKKVGYFDETLHYCMDYDFWLRLLKISSPIIIEDSLSGFRVHPASKGGSLFDKQFAEELQVAQRYSPPNSQQWLHRVHAWATVQAYRMIKV